MQLNIQIPTVFVVQSLKENGLLYFFFFSLGSQRKVLCIQESNSRARPKAETWEMRKVVGSQKERKAR